LPISGKGGSDWRYAPIPVVGPVLGGLLGAYFYVAAFRGEVSFQLYVVLIAVAVVILMAIRAVNRP